jgi:hypothetical protein
MKMRRGPGRELKAMAKEHRIKTIPLTLVRDSL